MRWRLSPRLTAGLLTALVWALVAGTALFWWLRAGGGGLPVDAQVAGGAPAAAAVNTAVVARVLGAPEHSQAAAPAADVTSRLALRGIVTYEGRGAALIAVDGKPAKPVRVGAPLDGVEGGWKLQSLTPRTVVLAAGDQQAKLEMPRLSERSSAGDAVAPTRHLVAPPPPVVPQGSPTVLPMHEGVPGSSVAPPGAPAARAPSLPPGLAGTAPSVMPSRP